MATITEMFVRKQEAQLPMKYVRLSMHSLLHRDHQQAGKANLDDIGKAFDKFIETPITTDSK